MKEIKATCERINDEYNLIVLEREDIAEYYIEKVDYGNLYYYCGLAKEEKYMPQKEFLEDLVTRISDFWEDKMEIESTIDVLESEKENLTRTLEECGNAIKDAKEIVDWLLTHNKNYTKQQYNKLLDLKEILEGE